MFISILKKDLKRKKTMNLILLLFIILSAMFAASSVNNIISVLGGMDYFFDKAGMADYYIVAGEHGNDSIEDRLKDNEYVTDFTREKILLGSQKNIKVNGEDVKKTGGISIFLPVSNAGLNYFDKNNDVITEVEKGKVYFPSSLAKTAELEVGDKLTVEFDDRSIELEYAGLLKDAFLGSDLMSNPKLLMNDSDFEELVSDSDIGDIYGGSIYYIHSDNVKKLETSLSGVQGIRLSCGDQMIRTSYMMNTFIAAIMLIMSVCLILISFIVLRFTIRFTIEEEFREIGVMKALGLKNGSIRALYLVKYFALALVGAGAGFAASLPFGEMMLDSVSKQMVLGNNDPLLIAVLASLTVVLIIMIFCWRCTSKIKKMSPIDAVRSGQTGERFDRKSVLSLGESKLSPTGFLSVNDVLSSPKSYGLITIIFTVCILMVMILANGANTINSDKILFLVGCTKSDAYIDDSERFNDIQAGIRTIDEVEDDIENVLAENGMPAKVRAEYCYKLTIESEKNEIFINMMQCTETKTEDYVYDKGTAPQNEHEIALTQMMADELEIGIGDTVYIDTGKGKEEYLLTATFSSMNQMGSVGRLHQDADMSQLIPVQSMHFQVNFDDHPDAAEGDRRIERMKDIFDNELIFNAKDFVDDCTKAGSMIVAVKDLLLIISAIILAMVSVLMERSFITKEKSEIALMKAIGLNDRKVIAQHVLRFGLAGVAAAVLAGCLCMPLTKLTLDPIFAIMGVEKGMEYHLRPLEVLGVYPVILIAIMMLSVFITSLYTKKITSSHTADIE